MDQKTKKVIYWISTGLMCAIFLFSASMYFIKTEMVKGFFEALNYPTYLVYPLAVAKILGIIAVLSDKSKVLKEWAYAGFFFDAVLAAQAHIDANDGGAMMSICAALLVIISRVFWNK
ncbi:MAG: DoxX family protein [Saprospiraceae bacterium]|nr:DoxX family protein [Saprospiraceae bacterium]